MTSAGPPIQWHTIPSSNATCKLYIMQAGGLYIPTRLAIRPAPNSDNSTQESAFDTNQESYYAPDYVFLIEHLATGNSYIFDLGIRPDLENLPPLIKENVLPQFKCEPKSPAAILEKYGSPEQQPEKVKAVIFSHMHFDHVGDGAQAGFHQAEMWVGPTCCTYARPGYPVEERAPTLTDTLPTDGSRKIVEAYVPDDLLKKAGDKRAGKVMDGMKKGLYHGTDLKKPDWIGVGAFEWAFDVFGDGSAYLIDAPGHSPGHQMMLVRTTASSSATAEDSTFVLLAGDCYHHPLILQDPRRAAHDMHGDAEVAVDTIWRTRKMAQAKNVWVVGAHDFSIGESLEAEKREFEGLIEIGGWYKKGWKKGLHANL